MIIHIKNMVCNRCIMVVSGIFHDSGFGHADVKMGKVDVNDPISEDELANIHIRLRSVGFEIINSHTIQIIEQIKKATISYIYDKENQHQNFSSYLADQLNRDYNYLSTLFSSVEGTTIENYMIKLKMERVKELLVYDEKTLSEISFELGYSSVAHLSGQFKRVTGFTTTNFKKMREQNRKSIDEI
jgi:AraC family transcriptional regulator